MTASSDDPLHGLPFRPLRRLGGGNTGEVFLAEHQQLGKECAVKVLHPRFAGNGELVERFLLAARALGHLKSPHIVSVTGAGITHDERPFIVMEFLQGRTLGAELAARRVLPLLEALDYTCQLLRALSVVHASGIVHRDVRPENLFLCDAPERVRTLKVVDFGLSRVQADAPADAPLPLPVPTDANVILGPPRYISPEGAQRRAVDHRADLYAAALVLYITIAGRGPFDHRRSETALLAAHATETPKPPSYFADAHQIPVELDCLLLHALQKDPGERFQTADAFREALEQIQARLKRSPAQLKTPHTLEALTITVPPRSTSERATNQPASLGLKQTASSERALLARTSVAPPRSEGSRMTPDSAQRQPLEASIDVQEGILIFLTACVLAAAVAIALVAQVRGGQ